MTEDQHKEILKRLSAVEVHVGRCVQALTGIAQTISRASNLPSQCGVCGNDPEVMKFCEEAYCPQGKTTKDTRIPTKDPSIPSKDNSVVYPDIEDEVSDE